ncbi:hypothetical protein Glove_87g29 [Diversispora epigaea]|uniref:Uncharacterized protein n=1 Tax=Diversispora epigaea TaxID=1348612 RepID=A0A397JFD7_9GLOM|nr:hypothetical protein Glove_87g29 [Diversispora epigaea]
MNKIKDEKHLKSRKTRDIKETRIMLKIPSFQFDTHSTSYSLLNGNSNDNSNSTIYTNNTKTNNKTPTTPIRNNNNNYNYNQYYYR